MFSTPIATDRPIHQSVQHGARQWSPISSSIRRTVPHARLRRTLTTACCIASAWDWVTRNHWRCMLPITDGNVEIPFLANVVYVHGWIQQYSDYSTQKFSKFWFFRVFSSTTISLYTEPFLLCAMAKTAWPWNRVCLVSIKINGNATTV